MKTLYAGLAALLVSAQAPSPPMPPAPSQPVEQQELQAITQLCELAKYASRVTADNFCQYFIQKYTLAAQEAKKTAEAEDAKKLADGGLPKPPIPPTHATEKK